MASKASMLKQGANKTGKGLFAGMSRLDAREEAASVNVEVTNDIVKEEKVTEKVNVPEKEETPVKGVEVPIAEPELSVSINDLPSTCY